MPDLADPGHVRVMMENFSREQVHFTGQQHADQQSVDKVLLPRFSPTAQVGVWLSRGLAPSTFLAPVMSVNDTREAVTERARIVLPAYAPTRRLLGPNNSTLLPDKKLRQSAQNLRGMDGGCRTGKKRAVHCRSICQNVSNCFALLVLPVE